jgi:ligand-binding sensor domain-containing protein
MNTQKTLKKMSRNVGSDSLALTLVGIFAAMMFIFSKAAWAQSGEWTVYNTSNSGLPYNGITVLDFDSQGNVWIGTGKWFVLGGGGLAKYDGENWTVFNTANSPLPHNDHFGLAIDPQGNVWSGTEGGLAKFDGTNWTVYKTSNSGLRNNRVATPVFDDQGHLWAGTWEGGLVKFDGVNWTAYNTANSGLPNNIPFATAFDKQGNLWIGTVGGGLVKFDGTNWTVFNTANSPLPNNTIFSICFDSQGNLWIATDGGGLAKFDGTSWIVFNTSNSELPSNRSWFVLVDSHDNVWIGTYDRGMAMFDGKEWTVYDTSNSGLPDNMINYIAIDTQGKIWIATQNGGLAVYYPGNKMPIVDFNGNGLVNIKDLLRLIESWGQNDPIVDIAPPPFGDGIVDALDLELLMSYWGQSVDDPTLVAHWALDEADGAIAYDSTGVKDAVVVGGTAWQPNGGQVDGALQLDGIDGCAVAGSVLNPADGPFSVFAWINSGAPGQVVVSQQGASNWLSVDAEGNLMTELKCIGRSAGPLLSQSIITDGHWHRVGFVWDGSNRTLYVDGIMVAEDTQDGLEGSDSGFYIGTGKAMQPGTYWSGLIDDVRIYNRAVSP